MSKQLDCINQKPAFFIKLISHLNECNFDPEITEVSKGGYIYLLSKYTNNTLFITKQKDVYNKIIKAFPQYYPKYLLN